MNPWLALGLKVLAAKVLMPETETKELTKAIAETIAKAD